MMRIELLRAMHIPMKRLLVNSLLFILAIVLPGYASSASVAVDFTNVADTVAGQDEWEARYTIKGPLGEFESVNLLFPAAQYESLSVTANSSPAQLSALATQPNPALAAPGQVLVTATGALDANFQSTVTVSFVWLGTGSPLSQPYELLDSGFNVVGTGTATGGVPFTPQILTRWNLLGNTGTVALDVTALFGTQDVPMEGVSQYVVSVWKWVVDPSTGAGRWAFFTPSLTKAESDAAALSQGYDALTTINPGEGFWVNRTIPPSGPVTLNGPASAAFYYDAVNFGALKKNAWHLIATGSAVEPSVFNSTDVDPSPTPGVVPTTNFQTLWAWSAPVQKWYFYAASIEANGYTSGSTTYEGLDAVRQAATDNGYLDFHTATPPKTLGSGVGFWVRR